MQERIKKIIAYQGITPSALADQIGVQRSNVTHILNGRNKPSFQFIEKLLQIFPDINAKWLILGEGSMIDSLQSDANRSNQAYDVKEVRSETQSLDLGLEAGNIATGNLQSMPTKDESGKDIEKLIVFYSDQTFKVYTPS